MRTTSSGTILSLLLAAACTQGHAPAHVASAQVKSGASASVGNACDRKLLTADDAAPSLGAPVTRTETIPGAPEACEFVTAGFASLTVTLRPGVGQTTVATWKSGRMPTAATPLAGVGDDAVWVAELHEVIAQQRDLLCDIQLSGVSQGDRGSPAEEQQRIGKLCDKIFVAVR